MASNWKEYSLSEITELVIDNRGRNPSCYSNAGIPVIDNYLIISEGEPELSKIKRFIDKDIYNTFIRKYNQMGDVLLTLVGNGYGNVAISPQERCIIIQNTIGLRTKSGFDNHFLYYLLKGNRASLTNLNRGAAQPSIKVGDVLNLCFYFPTYDQQGLIGNTLYQLDQKIRLNRQTNQTLEQMAQALFKSWFVDFDPVFDNAFDTGLSVDDFPDELQDRAMIRQQHRANAMQQGTEIALQQPRLPSATVLQPNSPQTTQTESERIRGLFPSEFEQCDDPSVGINGWIPKGGKVSELGAFIKFANGKAKKSSDEGACPIYGANGVIGKTNEFNFTNAVIVGRVGAYCGAIEYCRYNFWSSDNTIVAISKISESHIPFVFYQLKFLDLNQYAGGAAQPLLNQTTLNKLKVPFLSIECISKFNDVIDGFLLKQIKNTEQIVKLSEIRDVLLPKLISGELQLSEAVQSIETM
ncbi:restriction endonuclease subunit S [Shewanella sp. S1-49-MNA-CIBAN-0167]|uniref:restriction endonuclease subunit S n=1 Tax=Shewanella sp. S1-49-MNA-CIBAN-0167 TaxID=3140468 RepID=UPI003330F06D